MCLESQTGFSVDTMYNQRQLQKNMLAFPGAKCSSVVSAFAHGAMGLQIDHSWWTH